MAKRVLSLFLCCLMVIPCLTVPAKALPSVDIEINPVEFFDWVLDKSLDASSYFVGIFSDTYCAFNPEGGVHRPHNFVRQYTTYKGKLGYYYVCEYCGDFAGEVGQEAYNDYVDTLPATGYNSDGSLLWYLNYSYVYIGEGWVPNTVYLYCRHYDSFSAKHIDDLSTMSYSCNCDTNGNFSLWMSSGSSSFYWQGIGYYFKAVTPISGTYKFLAGPAIVGGYYDSSGKFHDESKDFSSKSTTYYASGVDVSTEVYLTWGTVVSALSFNCYRPGYKIVPVDTMLSQINNIYNITTRPTSITGGNYGIVGDNGQITKIEDNRTIINEINNTYYNPATGQSGIINNWSYDYSDRSYNLTLDSGNTVTVRYGDENITIIEGDVIYNIYYIIEGSVDDCTHEWYQTGHREGNCLTAEQRTYTCSKCGKQYTETDPAPGHSWRIIQEVSTKYDESGNLIQEGFTIYECERCKEQYKATNDTGPPPSGGGDSDTVDNGGLLEWINGLIKYLSDHLSGVVDLILSFFREIPGMFGGFLDFLSAMFPFLPDDVVFLFTFGIAAVVFIGIIKALRR